MTAGDHLNGMRFKHTVDEYLHHLQAGEHGELGVMHWHKDHGPRFIGERQFAPGEVSGILVPKQHQRQGIGSALFAEAQKYDPPAVHSINQSPEGSAWAERVPDREAGS
jgi:GNAT superfamily N-acetyltransferase